MTALFESTVSRCPASEHPLLTDNTISGTVSTDGHTSIGEVAEAIVEHARSVAGCTAGNSAVRSLEAQFGFDGGRRVTEFVVVVRRLEGKVAG